MLDREAPHSISSLTNVINMIVDLIRRYCSEIETVEMLHHEYTVVTQNSDPPPPYPGMERIAALSSSFNDVLSILCSNLNQIAFALDNPLSGNTPRDTTLGVFPDKGLSKANAI